MSSKPPPNQRGRPAVSKPLNASASASTAASRAREAAAKEARNAGSASASVSASASTSTMKITNVTRTTQKLVPRTVPTSTRVAPGGSTKSSSVKSVARKGADEAEQKGETETKPVEFSTSAAVDEETTSAPVVPDATQPAPAPATNVSETTSTPLPDDAPQTTSDPLQVAAQAYPWLYMSNTLEACFKTAEQNAERDIETRTKELEEEESEIADQRVRFETERVLDFYDELGTDIFTKEAPSIMQSFLSHGDACFRVEGEALELASRVSKVDPEDNDPLQVYHDMLDNLEELQAEAVKLESNIIRLTSASESMPSTAAGESAKTEKDEEEKDDSSSARTQIVGIFAACLPVLRARIANLSVAQELIDSATENLSITLRMESLGIE